MYDGSINLPLVYLRMMDLSSKYAMQDKATAPVDNNVLKVQLMVLSYMVQCNNNLLDIFHDNRD